jgi:hypothetical protein
MTNPPDEGAERKGAPRVRKPVAVAATLVLLALLVMAGAVTLAGLVPGVLAVGQCASHPHALSCSSQEIGAAALWLAIGLPPVGMISGLVIGAVASGRDIRRGRTGLRWAAAAWGVFGGALVLAGAVLVI